MWGAVAVLLTAATVLGGGTADLLTDGWIASPLAVATSTTGQPSLVVDLLQIQWWQGLAAFLVALGLSPAPWILGLAFNRIEFTAPAAARHKAALAEQQRHYEALLDLWKSRYSELEIANAANAASAETHRSRAEKLTDSAFEMTEVVRANTHVIESLNDIAREATAQ